MCSEDVVPACALSAKSKFFHHVSWLLPAHPLIVLVDVSVILIVPVLLVHTLDA